MGTEDLQKKLNKKNKKFESKNTQLLHKVDESGKKKIKSSKSNKQKKDKTEQTESKEENNEIEAENVSENEAKEHKKRNSKKNKRNNEKEEELHKTGKSKKAKIVEKVSSNNESNLLKKSKHVEDEVYEMSSGDEDSSKGMKKWILEYQENRPGLEVLQERIDDFITAHEEQKEKAREEREAQAADGGWTVVVHHKGRKKTTESESGVAVGSVAQAAVLDKVAKKKNKDVGLDFYRFQKREAHRNEIMMLQSKFEEDKKRIQQLRAQRKFRPY